MEGFIKLHRQLMNWEWYNTPNTLRLFLHLLLKANHKETLWKGIVIHRGEVLTGRVKLAEELGLSEQQIRTSKMHLISTNEITIKTTNQYSVITINHWDEYQAKQPANQRRINQPITTNKNEKNEENILQSNRTSSTEEKPSYGNMLIKKFKQLIAENNNNVVPVADSEAKTNRVYWNILQMLGVKKEHKAVIDTKELPVEVRVNINKFLDWFNAERTNKGLVVENVYTLKQNVLNFKTNFNAKT